MNFEGYPRQKIGDAKFYIHRIFASIKYTFTYTTFLTAEDKQI